MVSLPATTARVTGKDGDLVAPAALRDNGGSLPKIIVLAFVPQEQGVFCR